MRDGLLIWSLIALGCVGVMAAFGFRLGPEARLRRRRRKSHSPITSKSDKPTVKFSVRPPKE